VPYTCHFVYIRLHLQVDPHPFLFGSPARYAPCLVYLLHNKLNTFGSPASTAFRSAPSPDVPLHVPPDCSCPYTPGTTQIPSWTLYSTWIPTGTTWNHSDSKLDLIFHLDSNWIPTGIQLVPAGIQLELSRMQSH